MVVIVVVVWSDGDQACPRVAAYSGGTVEWDDWDRERCGKKPECWIGLEMVE